ncbi:hypothetical protein EK21DRAFT_104136 [Setomelanomma holmii]|uniref:Tat pathway signal sequence n=1 Tax=Setomelanomma holmii TaxID=210430 RepID=A0A9P4LHG6_9PLEO|nr:hypothetical protein EK21DRAFT_104136 [Setomelanomma holmii]
MTSFKAFYLPFSAQNAERCLCLPHNLCDQHSRGLGRTLGALVFAYSLWTARTKWDFSSPQIANVILFSISIIILSASRSGKIFSDQDYWRATSFYSPVFDRFSIPKLTRPTNGTFWDTEPPSIWRVRTGLEADTAWDSIGSNITPIVITAADVLALGKDPATAVKVPPELNHGSDAYIAGMDVFHHLHCLDKLRREISYKHYHEAKEGPYPGSELHEAHINHCLDVLSQALRCTGSVDMVTFNWVEGHRMPQPDFNNRKVCRDFDALRDWTVESGIDGNTFFKVANKPPPDAVVVPELKPQHHGR